MNSVIEVHAQCITSKEIWKEVQIDMERSGFRFCGGTWVYCDGDCRNCLKQNIKYSDHTERKEE